jgi:hypothetical protein
MRIFQFNYLSTILVAVSLAGCTADPIPLRALDEGVPPNDTAVSPSQDMWSQDTDAGIDAALMVDAAMESADAVVDGALLEDTGGQPADDQGMVTDAMAVDAGSDIDANFDPPTCRVEGPEPTEFCTGAALDEYYCDAFGGEPLEDPTAIGSTQPFWVLQDLQPQSCGFEQFYGLQGFHGTPTMVVLLWAGCGFCQAQTVKLQQMHYELQAMGVIVNFVIVDQSSEDPPIEYLTERCNFPILQDESGVNAWSLQGGRKDDFYFYDSMGVLKNFIPSTDDVVLTSYEDPPMDPTSGYTNVKNTVLDLVEHDGEPPVILEPMEPTDEN